MRHYIKKNGSGLIDVLIAVFILSISFVAVFAVLRLSTELVGHTRARIGATALANEAIEYARSLPYNSVGTVGGIPTGAIPQSETILFNGITYTRRILIQYVDDPKDGLAGADANNLTADYKRIKVEVSWVLRGNARKFSVISNIVPKGIETIAGGGTLQISVIDALGAAVPGAKVHIENNSLVPPISIDTYANAAGTVLFPGSPSGSSYEITVTRAGMSTDQTYDTNAGNPNPNPRHLTVLQDQITSQTFQIDFLGSKTIQTFLPITQTTWQDTFADANKIFEFASTTVVGGVLELVQTAEYEPTGYAISHSIQPATLRSWDSFSWNDALPLGTSILYRVDYIDGGNNVVPVPDTVLPGNTAGFSTSPVNISSIDPLQYPSIQVVGELSTTDTNVTPSVLDWHISYTTGPTPLPSISFTLQGKKTIGTTGAGAPIYKYNQSLTTNGVGTTAVLPLEYDVYDIIVAASTGYDIGEVCPPQPFTLDPGISTTTGISLVPNSAHSLLVVVKNGAKSVLSGATIHLYDSGGIDRTQATGGCGQTFFSNLPQGTVGGGNPYSISVTLSGYQVYTSTEVDVSGVSQQNITLAP